MGIDGEKGMIPFIFSHISSKLQDLNLEEPWSYTAISNVRVKSVILFLFVSLLMIVL